MHDSAEFMKSSNSLLNEIDQISNDTGYRKWEIQTRLCTVCISFFFFFFLRCVFLISHALPTHSEVFMGLTAYSRRSVS